MRICKLKRLTARNEEIAEDQSIHLRAEVAIDGFFGAADDWLIVVEGSVEHNRHASEIVESGNERVIAGIGFASDGLQPARAIDVRRRWNLAPFLRAHGVGEGHERRGMRLLEVVPGFLRKDGRRRGGRNLTGLDAGRE